MTELMLEFIDQFEFLLAVVTSRSRNALVVIGLAAFAGGVLLMFRHKREIEGVQASVKDSRQLRFEKRKYRRRSLASAMIAAIGILMTSLYWARELEAFATLISVVLILLLAVMFLAFLDLMSVSLQRVTEDDPSARKKLVDEYLRQRQKRVDPVEDTDPPE